MDITTERKTESGPKKGSHSLRYPDGAMSTKGQDPLVLLLRPCAVAGSNLNRLGRPASRLGPSNRPDLPRSSKMASVSVSSSSELQLLGGSALRCSLSRGRAQAELAARDAVDLWLG